MSKRRLIHLSILLGFFGCAAEKPPAVPSWDLDVYPILRGSCSHCHGVAVGGLVPGSTTPATPTTRYDICDGNKFKDAAAGVAGILTGFSLDAQMRPQPSYAPGATGVALLFSTYVGPTATAAIRMPPPPAAPLSDYEVQVLTNWAKRPSCDKQIPNRRPTARIVTAATRVLDRTVVIVELSDVDGDQVYGANIKLGTAAPLEIPGAPRFEGVVQPLEIPGAGRWRLEFPASATGMLTMTLFDGYEQTAVAL